MAEFIIGKFSQLKYYAGFSSVILLFSLVVFLVLLVADTAYGTTTNASSFMKIVTLVVMGVSFVFFEKGRGSVSGKQLSTFVSTKNKVTTEDTTVVPEAAQEASVVTAETQEALSVYEQMLQELDTHLSPERATKQKASYVERTEEQAREEITFLGVNILDIVSLSENYGLQISFEEITELMTSNVYDKRVLAIWLLITQLRRGDIDQQKEVYDFYINHRGLVNNWDMVDLAARNIVGEYLKENTHERSEQEKLATSSSLWDKRTSLMSVLPVVTSGNLAYGFISIERLINSQEDLVQSAIGWVLKESYKQDSTQTEQFIKKHFYSLSKQAIRIGTERMNKEYRKDFLRGDFSVLDK